MLKSMYEMVVKEMNSKLVVKKILGEKNLARVRRLKLLIRIRILKLIAKSRRASRIYTLLFSSHYDREINAVINGHIRFLENKEGAEAANYHLRRCIHRLEKGLSMPSTKAIFATDYIEDTVNSFCRSIASPSADLVELRWAKDVLNKYFSLCQGPSVIERSRKKFIKALSESSLHDGQECSVLMVPYVEEKRTGAPIAYDAMLDLAKWRRSVRWYENKSVPRDLIDKAIEVAAYSPSACNRQPFEFLVIDDAELLAAARELPMGVKGFADGFPMMVAIIGKLRAYPEVRDRHVIYVDGGLAAMTLMYALESLGLSSCPINWPDIEQRERLAEKILNLNKDERIVMWLSIGYAAKTGFIPYSAKLSVENLRRFN